MTISYLNIPHHIGRVSKVCTLEVMYVIIRYHYITGNKMLQNKKYY